MYRYRPLNRGQSWAAGRDKSYRPASPQVTVYGTLDRPVHAVNLEATIKEIEENFANPFIIAVDACLGRTENIGFINIKPGPLRPGTGVNKHLPAVGQMHIIGVVNVGGFMEYLVLQNTRLSLVMRMAEVISTGLINSCHAFFQQQNTTRSETALFPARTKETEEGAFLRRETKERRPDNPRVIAQEG